MNRDSNVYTFTFAALMVFVVASVLAFTSFSLKDLQNENVRKEKMQNILSTVGIQTDREGAEKLFDQYIKEQLAVQSDGSIDNSVNVFKEVKLALELKKSPDSQDFPLYVAEIDSEKFYIIPIRGNGLWNAIFGYISLKEDLNTIKGVTSFSLKDLQNENVRKEKMQNILSTVGIQTDREGAEKLFDQYIKEQLAVQSDGSIDNSVNVFKEVKLALELKKSPDSQDFPLYVAEIDSEKFYIIPIRGNGLWNAIFGYISLKEDLNTIKGVVFDHVGETAGLGAEITQDWFIERFIDEKLFDANRNLMGITVSKTNNDPSNLDKTDHEVDAISGATITGDGVTDMIKERITHYVPYFEFIKSTNSIAAMSGNNLNLN